MVPVHSLPGLTPDLYEKLNSQERFSSYPPVCQLIYWLSVKLSPDSVHGSVLIMKNILFIFEAATLWMLRKMILRFQLQHSAILIYALNPLVILEITGNLHFEGVMVFFLIAAVYALTHNKFLPSSAAFALSICTKLIPLLFLPLFFHVLGWKKAITYWLLTAMITGIMFIPLMGEDIVHGFSTSLGYYFQRFEFNASLYYVIREVGFLMFGFNIIQYVGPGLAAVAMIFILDLAFRRYKPALSQNMNSFLYTAMLWCMVVYFLSTTILHPWYTITLLAISAFTPYRFPMIWTGLIFLTYAGYNKSSYDENLVLVAIEYIVVIACAFYETTWIHRTSHS
jgi:Gpi18-like mannosyltransferase